MKYSDIYKNYKTFYAFLCKDYKKAVNGLLHYDYSELDFSSMDKRVSEGILEILNDRDFKLALNNTLLIGYNPLFLISSLSNNYLNTIKLLLKKNEERAVRVPSFDREDKLLEDILVDNSFVLSSKSLSLINNSPIFLLASLKSDAEKTIKVLNNSNLYLINMSETQVEELIELLFYKKRIPFKKLPDVIKNTLVVYINDCESISVVFDLIEDELIPSSYFPSDVIYYNDRILEKGCNSSEEEDYLRYKIGDYVSSRYEKEDEDIFLKILGKKYKGCNSVEDVIRQMHLKGMKREDMSLMEVFSFNLYAAKVLKSNNISTNVDAFGYDHKMSTGGSQNERSVTLYINGANNSVIDMLNTLNHEIEHAIQKSYISDCRLDLDYDLDLYCKDLILYLIYKNEYYDKNSSSISFEYDAEFKANVRTAKVLNLVESNNIDFNRYKMELIKYAKSNMDNSEYFYEMIRVDTVGYVHINELFEYAMQRLKEQDEIQYYEVIERNPLIKYEYKYKNEFERKSIEELVMDMDSCSNNKDKGIYYLLIKIRIDENKNEDVEYDVDKIKELYRSDRFKGVTQKILKKLVQISSCVTNKKYEGYINRGNNKGR